MSSPGGGFFARWERYWFGEASLVRLAVFRIVLMCAAFDGVWLVRQAVFERATQKDALFLNRAWDPIYAFELLDLGPPGPVATQALWIALLVAIGLGLIGLFTRVACAAVAVLFFYWIGSEYGFGKPHHTCIVLMFALAALPFGPVGARVSVDSLLRRLRAAKRGEDPLAVPERAAWAALPLRFAQITLALGYFFAGATKLAKSGLEWINGYTLQGIMVEYHSAWSGYLIEHNGLLVLMSIGLLFGQVGFPLVFLGTWARWLFVPLMILFHLMAMQTMATGTFLTLWLALSAFLALERIPAFLERWVGSGPGPRRIVLGALLAVLAYGLVAIYAGDKPVLLPLLFLPVAALLGLAACPRLLPPIQVRFDPRVTRERRAAAWIAAADWARRIELRAEELRSEGAGDGLRVLDAQGQALEGGPFRVLARLPLALLCAPFLAGRFARRR